MGADKIAILDLKPAQIAIGLLEVERKMEEYAHLSRDEFHAYSEAHPVPVVKSAHGFYIIDHHHLCRAFHELGHQHVNLAQQADFSAFGDQAFWELMEKANWVLPQDQYGVRHPYGCLPMDVRGMADDPYRSLVWKLKTLDRWLKPPVPFAEFVAANFLRGRVEMSNTRESFDRAVDAAIALIDRLTPGELAQAPGFQQPTA
jgi:hypothetical protein